MGQGAVGAFIATGICCLLPAVAIAIGLTGSLAATLVNLSRFRFYGILAGLVFVVIISSGTFDILFPSNTHLLLSPKS